MSWRSLLVFYPLGIYARKKKPLITNDGHLVLNQFTQVLYRLNEDSLAPNLFKTNQFLKEAGRESRLIG